MSHPLPLLQDLLLTLFLALGCAWFAIDLARKLRAPGNAEPRLGPPATPRADLAPSLPPPVASEPACAPPPAATTPAAPAAGPLVAGVPAPHLVAITAAVHHLFKGRARLASVLAAPVPAAASASSAPIDWAREGRRDIFTSHRVR